jgi:hypothetical protein
MNTTLTASGISNGIDFSDVEIVNPGKCFGNTFLVSAGVGNVGTLFIVEAYHEQDAVEEFASSRYGHLIVLDEEMTQEAMIEGTIDDYVYTESGYCDLSYFGLTKTDECVYLVKSDEFWKLEI